MQRSGTEAIRTQIQPSCLCKNNFDSLLTVPRRWFCCGSRLPVFGVKVSVTFHLTCVHIIFSSVSVAEWPPFGAAHSVDHMFFLYFDYL